MELRRLVRYRLDLPVTYRWTDENGHQCLGAGFTRDISNGAMFVLSDACPSADAELNCDVMLPRVHSSGFAQIKVAGRVVRIEKDRGRACKGFVVLGDMLLLCNEVCEESC